MLQFKRFIERSITAVLVLALMLSAIGIASAAERESLEFQPSNYGIMDKPVESIPTTVEVWVKLQPDVDTRQIIIGNYKDGKQNSWSLELTADNRLRYWEEYYDAQGVKKGISNLYVTGVDVATNEWMLLSVVRDVANQKIIFYKNGTKVFEKIGYAAIAPYNTPSPLPMYVGTDYRKSMWLNGGVSEIRLWNDMRTPEEISQYVTTELTGSESGLAHAWHLSDAAGISPTTTFDDLVRTNPIKITTEGFQPGTVGSGVDYSHPFNAAGISFTSSDVQYAMKNKLPNIPRSFEALIKLPKDLQGNRGGIIAGNYMEAGYYDYDLPYVNFEVTAKGEPRLYWKKQGKVQDTVITGVDLRQDRWVHVAMTFDETTDQIKCYINGRLVATQSNAEFQPDIPAQPLKIGGDYRKGNSQYFKGEIADVRIWSTIRTEQEIGANMETEPVNQAGLLGNWQFEAPLNGVYPDNSPNRNDVSSFADWIAPTLAKGDYSMVVLPDTQFLTESYPDKYYNMMNWIKDNKSAYNIQAVMSMGDIVNVAGNEAQWQVAQKGFNMLDGVVPYTTMLGNHDMSMSLDRAAVNYNKYFPYPKFSQMPYFGGAFKDGYMDNAYYFVTVGDKPYMIFSVAFAPNESILNWVNEQIAAHPEKNVILTTHAYMYWNGEQLSNKYSDYPSKYIRDAKNGDDVWKEVASQHKNVILVMSGHIGYPDLVNRVDTGIQGKRVNQMLADAQGMDLQNGGYAMLMLLTFHNDSNKVDVNWYSTDKNQLFRERNQFTLEMDYVKNDVEAPETTAVITPSQPDGTNGWYVHPVTVSLDAYDNLSGVSGIEYSYDGGNTWLAYSAPVTVSLDGNYVLAYRSKDQAGNLEATKTTSFKLDATAPEVAVTGVVYGSHSDAGDIAPVVILKDNLSGVADSKTQATLDGMPYQPGESMELYELPLGTHTLVVNGSDLAGNTGSQAVVFQTYASIEGLKKLVTRFAASEWIDNGGIANSLQKKLEHGELQSFIHEVNAQSGKHIDVEAAGYLLRDAQALFLK
ncbi:LamG-like jellyroll fold domain-containing protein [Bacillus sp. 3255]|uniref:LamG-like jellyroll fold domain-containing protein n=1 Tax=Bacillus sp. 3255 TaxID=2817904 RepID=UPI00285BBAC8|nr:LamG-like jellyroll fold domain-containing protein [Bacillus sp. 3255]MDR6880826.1 hypothetical protein [Bacillus sp. 3255]